MLELVALKKKYTTKAGDTLALDGISLRFAEKGLVFITGKSGSGKTTLLNVIGGLDSFDEGDIKVHGKSLSTFSAADFDSYRNTFVGFIFQEYNLLPEYDVLKNVAIANELQGKEWDKEEIARLFKEVEIEGLEERKISQLSGGQKQRIAIVRALVKSSQIILADELTGALDSKTGEQVMTTLKRLSKEKLVIVVSHDLELAEKYGDRIIKIVDGRIAEDITLTDKETEGNIHEKDGRLTVRLKSDLSEAETEKLRSAVKEGAHIDFTDSLSIRERSDTVQPTVEEKEVALIPSKMKFSSALSLGLKSLVVKPWRLILTLLLSAIAFACVGVLDAVASFGMSKAVQGILEESYYSALPVYATYSDDFYEDAKLKISQAQIDKWNERTGYSFRGVYELKDTEYVSDYSTRRNYNEIYEIAGLPNKYRVNPKGYAYYSRDLNGMVVFSSDEIVGDTLDPEGFGYKIVYGSYPQYDPKAEIPQAAISTYTAKSILFWLKSDKVVSFGEKSVNQIEDLVGAKLRVADQDYFISGLIDCGEIPEKYDALLTTDKDAALKMDFESYRNAGCFMTLFAPEGFIESGREESGRTVCYFADYGKTHKVSIEGTRYPISDYAYDVADLKDTNVLFFDGRKEGLKDNETLVDVADLIKEYFAFELKSGQAGEELVKISSLNETLTAEDSTHGQKQFALSELVAVIEKIQAADSSLSQTVYKTLTAESYDEEGNLLDKKDFTVVGVYTGIKTELINAVYSKLNALTLTKGGLESLNVMTEQGIYSRMITPLTASRSGIKTLSSMTETEEGFQLCWYENGLLKSVETDKKMIGEYLDLFFYGAMVLTLFSVFMLFNYISVSILSKKQSLGVLRALGANNKNIFTMFMAESLTIAIISGILGIGVAILGCGFINGYLVEIMNLSFKIAMFDIKQGLLIMGSSVLAGILSSILPIAKIAKEKPVNLIRKL